MSQYALSLSEDFAKFRNKTCSTKKSRPLPCHKQSSMSYTENEEINLYRRRALIYSISAHEAAKQSGFIFKRDG